MGRPKKVVVDIPEEDFAETTQDEIELGQFLENYGASSATLKVYRVPDRALGHTGQPRFVEITQYEDLDESVMRERYGTGTYVLKFFNSKSQYVASKRIFIDPLKLDPRGSAHSSSPNGGGGSDMLSFLRDQMAQQQTLMLGLIAAMGQGLSGGNRGPDIGQLMAGMGTLLGAVKPPSIDPTSIMTTIIGAVSTLTPKSNGNEDYLDKMAKVIDIAQGLAPRGEDSLLGVARDIGSRVVDAFAPRQAEHGRVLDMGPGRIIEPRPAIPAGAVPLNTNQQKSQEELMWEWLKQQLQYLKMKAAAGKDVDFWIDSTFENDDEPGNRAILQAVSQGATMEHLLQFDPEIGKNPALRDWFGKFYHGIHEGLQADGEAGPENLDSQRKAGHGTDTADHARPGPPGRGTLKVTSGDTEPSGSD